MYMLFAGLGSVCLVKICDQVLENAELQTTKETLTSSKHLIEFTYSEFPSHLKENRLR